MNPLNTFVQDGVKIRIIVDAQSAAVLALALFMALVMALFVYARIK